MPNHPNEAYWEGPDYPPDDPAPPNPMSFPVHFLMWNVAHALSCSYHFALSDPKFPGIGLCLSPENETYVYDDEANKTLVKRKEYTTGGIFSTASSAKTLMDNVSLTTVVPGFGGAIPGTVMVNQPKGSGWFKMQ